MIVKIHGTKDYFKGNTQSCGDIVDYLGKENTGKDLLQQEQFFNQTSNNVVDKFVTKSIDNNKKGLKEKEAKFYMVTINPWEKELKHLAKIATNGKDINDISEMKPNELEKYNNLLKEYARQVMDDYAKAFNKGLTGKDLLYYGKLEQERHYSGRDKDVREGLVNQYYTNDDPEVKNGTSFLGDARKKEGLQTHIHIIVSRLDKEQETRLSPLANGRGGSTHKLNGRNVTVGMDRDNFFKTTENTFDRMYDFERNYENTYAYQKFQANPLQGLQQASNLANQAVHNPEGAAKNAAIMGINKLTDTKLASHVSTASNIIQNPESAKDVLINQLDKVVSQLLPPEVKVAKQIAEKVIKPLKELGSAGLEI